MPEKELDDEGQHAVLSQEIVTTTVATRSQQVKPPKPTPTSNSSWRLSSLFLVLALASSLRLYLFSHTGVSELLQQRLELSDPFSSWFVVRQTAWSLDPPQDVLVPSPYQAPPSQGRTDLDAVLATTSIKALPPPLLMALLEQVLPESVAASPATVESASIHEPAHGRYETSALLFTLADGLAALLIYRIASLRSRSLMSATHSTHRKLPTRLAARHLLQSLSRSGLRLRPDPLWVATIYAFSPLSVMTCLSKSGTTISSVVLLLAVWGAMEGSAPITGLSLALASCISLHPVLLLPAGTMLCAHQKRHWRNSKGRSLGRRKKDLVSDWLGSLVVYALSLTGLLAYSAMYISHKAGGGKEGPEFDWVALANVYKAFLLLPSLTPSLSLWWYFFIEIFEHFRGFYLLVFNVHLLSWTIPVSLRFRHDPLFALFLLLGVQAVFKPYPTAGDANLFLILGTLFSGEYASYLRNRLPSTMLYLYSSLLLPIFSRLFLVAGSANANFLYAAGLVWSLAGVVNWLDWLWAGGRGRFEVEREAGLLELEDEEDEDGVEATTSAGYKRAVIQV